MKTNWHVATRKQALEEGVLFRSSNLHKYGWVVTIAYDPYTGEFGVALCRTSHDDFDRKFGQALAYKRMRTQRGYSGLLPENICNQDLNPQAILNQLNIFILLQQIDASGDQLPSKLVRQLAPLLG